MDKSYRFLSDAEPTDEQLSELMTAVLNEVKVRATESEKKHQALMQKQLAQTFAQWNLIQVKNEGK